MTMGPSADLALPGDVRRVQTPAAPDAPPLDSGPPSFAAGWRRRLSALARLVAQFTHLSAIYAGIAVLVTAVLLLTMPALRDQMRDVRAAMLDTLRQEGRDEGLLALYERLRPDGETPAEPDAADTVVAGDLPPPAAGSEGAGADVSPAPPNFGQALRAALRGVPPDGMQAGQFQALRAYLARKYRVANTVAGALVHVVVEAGARYKLDPQLLLAVIAIESRYNPYAESHVGAQGLMQVMTRVHQDKFEAFPDGLAAALQPVPNILVGTRILHDCLRRRGSLEGALACYVGATGPSDGGYGAKVMAEWRRIALASGIPVGKSPAKG